MAIRFAAVLLTALTIAAPAVAETGKLSADLFLDPQEAEAAASMMSDLAGAGDAPLVQLPGVDVPEPLALLDPYAPLPPEPVLSADLGASTSVDVEASLAPEYFLDADEGETFASIAADLASSGEIVTGSIPSIPDMSPLTDDAVDLEAYLTP